MNPPDTGQPVQQGSLSTLIRYLSELSAERAFAKVEITLQNGRIAMIHVDRAYRLNELPVKGHQ